MLVLVMLTTDRPIQAFYIPSTQLVQPSIGSVGHAYDHSLCESFLREPRVRVA
jgi:hypothetical protein